MDVMMALSLLLKNVVYHLPVLIVLVATLIIVLSRTEPGKLRNAATIGLILILFTRLLSSSFPLLSLLLGYDYLRLGMLTSGLGFALSLLYAIGFGLLAWALVKALPKNQSYRD